MRPVHLAVFDVDGTLVDGQHNITAAMAEAFAAAGLGAPAHDAVRRIIGLSLLEAVGRLLPGHDAAMHERIAELYSDAFVRRRQQPEFHEPMFDGAREAVHALADSGWTLAIATGKSRRGVDALLERLGFGHLFASIQTADVNPGKPDPTMLVRAMGETGATPATTVMIGDTTFDMQMAVNAGCAGIGVAWGYHAVEELRAAGARQIVASCGVLCAALAELRGTRVA